jgi:hypothetical protein
VTHLDISTDDTREIVQLLEQACGSAIVLKEGETVEMGCKGTEVF